MIPARVGGTVLKIKDPDFGSLTYDDEIEAWTGRLRTDAFADCALKWNLSASGKLRDWSSDAEDKDAAGAGGVAISVADGGNGRGPGPAQRAALAAFRAKEAGVRAAVFAEVARVARDYLKPGQLPAGAAVLTSQRDLAKRLCTVEGVTEWLDRPRVDFHRTGKKGVAYTSFNFAAGFDDEHGIAVLMLADQVRKVGGESEFYDQ
jgi:hypothetical protein